MKRMLLVATSVFALTSTGCSKIAKQAGLSFGSDFEGEITMNATRTQGSGPTQLLFAIKKPKYRVDATGNVETNNPLMSGGATLLLDPPQKKGYALVPAQKKAIVLDFDKMKAASNVPGMNTGPGSKSNQPPPKVEKTGKKETIAGYDCEVWIVTPQTGPKAEVCMADGITWVDLGDLGWSSPELTIGAVATGANKFPLRISSGDTKLEATKIEKKKLDDSRFVVPPDYQVIDIGAMMQNLPFQLPKK